MFGLLFTVLMGLGSSSAQGAGIFTTPRFVTPGEFAVGVEPEVVFTHGAGLGLNLRFTQGLTDLNNLNLIIGTGSGPRGFRAGGNFTFDIFPDIEGQPGMGIAAQAIYYRIHTDNRNDGQMELTAVPYIHKSFQPGDSDVDPFVAFPIGMAFSNGSYKAMSQLAIGANIQSSEKFRYILEFGLQINHSETYMSGGFVYYH